MSRMATSQRLLVILILALVALGIAGHFVYDLNAASCGGTVSAGKSWPLASTGFVCNALLHLGLLLAPIPGILWVLVFFWLEVNSRQEYRRWAPLTPFHPPIFA